MIEIRKFMLILYMWTMIHCLPYDDGKYQPKKYGVYDDGKYYRSLEEGKYIPGDEGKYTYIYKQGLYPTDDGDYRYRHQAGPDGGNGKDGSGYQDGSNKIEYIGHKTYAKRYPYIHKVIEALISQYVSPEALFGEDSQSSMNHYTKVYADKEVAVKCHYITPGESDLNVTEFTTQYPPRLELEKGENLGSYYSFKGTKVLNTVENALTSKLKLQYEVFVRVVEETDV